MGRTSKIIIIGLMCLTLTAIAFGVDFIVRDDNGAFIYDCINTCGPVKVKKAGKCKYLVHSKYYRGLVYSCKTEHAARKACGELPFDKPVRETLISKSCL